MYQKILKRPRKWDERSLALATKEELAADLLLRKAQMNRDKSPRFPWGKRARKREAEWIQILNQELDQRRQWIIEE